MKVLGELGALIRRPPSAVALLHEQRHQALETQNLRPDSVLLALERIPTVLNPFP
jgi:hypothetical protein